MNYKTFLRQFEAHIAQKTRIDEMCLLYLLQHCEPVVRDKIERFTSVNPCEGYRMAQNELFYEYGQPHVMAQRCEQELKALAGARPHDSDSLMKLSVLMNKCCTSLEGVANTSSVDTMDVMISIVKKLPVLLRLKWVDVSAATEERTGHCATFADLTTFVTGLTKTANSIFGKAVLPSISNRSVVAKRSVAVVHNVVAIQSSEKTVISKPAVKCWYCKRQHSLKSCYKLKACRTESVNTFTCRKAML